MIKRVLRPLLAVVIGYAVMVVLITLVSAGFLTMLCAYTGAVVATLIAPASHYLPAGAMSARPDSGLPIAGSADLER
jgi:hypothetical protein